MLEEFSNLKTSLEQFRDLVIEDAKTNLATPQGKYNQPIDASGKLSKSIKAEPVVIYPSGSLEFIIKMEHYGAFIDQGVSGVEQKYDTPYSYKSKGGKNGLKGMPPPKAMDKWIVRRGIAPKDEKGRFLPRKSIQFMIAVGVFKKGIKPSLFFTKPFKKHFKMLPEILAEAYGLDAAELVRLVFMNNKKKKNE